MDAVAARGSGKVFRCQRSAKEIPLAAPRCAEPKAYCKWRPACPIHALEKEASRGG